MAARGSGSESSVARFGAVVAEVGIDDLWLDEAAVEVAASIHEELAELGGDEDMVAATYESSRSILGLFIATVEAEGRPEEAEPPLAAVAYAREFVRRGLPVETLLRTYQVGQACFYRRFADAARAAISDPETIALAMEEGAHWTFEFVDVLLPVLLRQYAEERDRWVRSAAAVRRQTVQALLAGEELDPEVASARLGHRLDRHHRAFVVWGEDGAAGDAAGAALERAAAELADRLGAPDRLLIPSGPLLVSGWLGSDLPLPGPLPLDRLAEAGGGVRAAFGMEGAGVAGFVGSHREAMQARRVARLSGAAPGSITVYREVSLVALAGTDPDHARRFVVDELGPLAAGDEATRRLAATVLAYLEERGSPRRTAQRLEVHENTIANRIRRAEELLGRPLDRRVPEKLVALRLVLLAAGPDQGAPPDGLPAARD
jgi:hypothetical protein